MQNQELPSQNSLIKTRSRFFSFLAFRVLIVSFVFIVVPLIFYAFFLFTQGYNQKLRDIFEELRLYQEDQNNYIDQMEINYLNFLDSFHKMVQIIQTDPSQVNKNVTMVLSEFASRSRITGIFYLKLMETGKLICTDSTQPLYLNIDFSPYFDIVALDTQSDNIFIGKDPVFDESLYLSYSVHDQDDKLVGFVALTVALDPLIDQISSLPSIYETNLSILNASFKVLTSTEPTLKQEVFFIPKTHKEENFVSDIDNLIELEPMEHFDNAFKFKMLGVKRFGLIARFPHTDGYLFLSVPAKVVIHELMRYLWQLGSFLIFITLIGGGSAYLLTLRISKPLQQLGVVMTKVGEGDLKQQFIYDPMGFEINYLGAQFNTMVSSLVTYIDEVQKERASKEAIKKELQIGHDIQNSILPEKIVVFPGIKVSVFFKAAKEVAGDFYDWMIIDSSLIITIADGVGKGVSSCLYSFDLRSIIRSFILTHDDFAKVISETNRLFCLDTKDTGNFVTAFMVKYNNQTRRLEYANCGHNHPFLKRQNGTIERLVAKGIAFGVETFETVDVKDTTLSEGDIIILYTDGINEAFNKRQETFGEKRLEEVIASSKAKDPDELIQEILKAVNTFTEGEDQFDDMTLVVCQVRE